MKLAGRGMFFILRCGDYEDLGDTAALREWKTLFIRGLDRALRCGDDKLQGDDKRGEGEGESLGGESLGGLSSGGD